MQNRLAAIDTSQLKSLLDHSKDEAVRIALSLAMDTSRPVSGYFIEDKYKDASALGDLLDDLMEAESTKKEDSMYSAMTGLNGLSGFRKDEGGEWDDQFPAEVELGGGEGEGGPLSEEVAQACSMWKQDYGVIPGISWGSLPKTMQMEWKYNNCDRLVM